MIIGTIWPFLQLVLGPLKAGSYDVGSILPGPPFVVPLFGL